MLGQRILNAIEDLLVGSEEARTMRGRQLEEDIHLRLARFCHEVSDALHKHGLAMHTRVMRLRALRAVLYSTPTLTCICGHTDSGTFCRLEPGHWGPHSDLVRTWMDDLATSGHHG